MRTTLTPPSHTRLQLTVFSLVAASFTNIYITQPVLPVLQQEFAAGLVQVSFTVSAVILGIAIANLPFGMIADRFPIHPIVLTGGLCVCVGGLICSMTTHLWILIGARFFQGLFIPALTTCLAAYLAKTLPVDRLNVVMGSYVSATVVGGLGGRLLGGWIHPPLHWRYAFVSASVMILMATVAGFKTLPKADPTEHSRRAPCRFMVFLTDWTFLRVFLCASGSFAIFSSVFNYLPFKLSAPPFSMATETITMLYLVYIVGIFMGPMAGRISNRFGSGPTLMGGSVVILLSLFIIWIPSIIAVIVGLLGLCTGFFSIHAAAVGSLNRRLTGGQGRANALYVLFYYLGGWFGITGSGITYKQWGWTGLTCLCLFLLVIPLATGFQEYKKQQ
ncbi:MAG: MFS transporter [Pseudomonadota bacterium]